LKHAPHHAGFLAAIDYRSKPPTLFDQRPESEQVPAHHLLRPIRLMVDEAWKSLDSRFEGMYGEDARKSIPPKRLLPRVAAANVLHDPQRANADGGTRLSAKGPSPAWFDNRAVRHLRSCGYADWHLRRGSGTESSGR
jgi:hypothetical protein